MNDDIIKLINFVGAERRQEKNQDIKYLLSIEQIEMLESLIRADERLKCIKDADDQWVKNPNVSGGDAIQARVNSES